MSHRIKDNVGFVEMENNIQTKEIKPVRLFHYTMESRLAGILNERLIRLSTALLCEGEKPVVWLSFNQRWEQSATKYLGMSFPFDEVEDIPYRIEVNQNCAPYTFNDFRRLSGCPKFMADALIEETIGANHDEWRVSFKPISSKDWLSIEWWEGMDWDTEDYLISKYIKARKK